MEKITVQSVTLAGLSVNVPDKPVSFPGQSGTFDVWVLDSRIFITGRQNTFLVNFRYKIVENIG